MSKMVPVQCKSNGKNKEFEHNFCRKLSLVKKKSEDKENSKLTTFKFCTEYGKNIIYFP